MSGVAISVVVPTHNRGARLTTTLRHLLDNDVAGLGIVEIAVVDDGSTVPAAHCAHGLSAGEPFRLTWLRQPNRGPAAARNLGFGATSGSLVLFVDDDILAPRSLMRQHVDAHRVHPGAIICGRCPFDPAAGAPALRNLLRRLDHDPFQFEREVQRVTIVASGQMSLPRALFPTGRVYDDSLRTPAAEEYELSFRLAERGIPVYLAPQIGAIHDQELEIGVLCRQQYKHGLGCGEVARKRPEVLALAPLRSVIVANGPRGRDGTTAVKRLGRAIAVSSPGRRLLLALARTAASAPLPDATRIACYRAALSAQFVAGVRAGLDADEPSSGHGDAKTC